MPRTWTLLRGDAAQRLCPLREWFDAVRSLGKAGCPWRWLPPTICRPGRPCSSRPNAGARRAALRRWCTICASGYGCSTSAAPGRPPRSWMGAPCRSAQKAVSKPVTTATSAKKGSKVHVAVDTPGHLLAVLVNPANEQERVQVGELAKQVQEATQRSVHLAYVDQGYTGQTVANAAAEQGIELEVVKLAEAKRGFVLLPRRWVVERSFAWLARFRRLSRDDERLPSTLAGLHWLAFTSLLLSHLFKMLALSA